MKVGGYHRRCEASLSDLSRRAPLFAKTHNFFVSVSAREATRHSRYRNCTASVGVVNGDGLVRVCKISYYTLCEYVERAAEKNFIGGGSDDVYLHIECEAIKSERYVSREAE